MPSQAQKGQARTSEWQPWPTETRPHYIKLFALQERLRAHLKMAQQLALKNYRVKHPDSSPRKTNPIRIVSRQDDYLKKYREDQWPEIKHYLLRMHLEIKEIKKAYKGGRPPKWHDQIVMVETLTEQILEKMEMIQANLIITFQGQGQTIKEINKSIIAGTARVLIIARDLREVLLFVPLDRAKVSLDEYGFEAIVDLSPKEDLPEEDQEQHTIDFTQMEIWQQSQQHKKRG